MIVCALVEERMLPIPAELVADRFGPEMIVDENGNRLAAGESYAIRGSREVFLNWVRPFGGIWTSNAPALGDWTFHQVDTPPIITIPLSAWQRFKKEYKEMPRELRMGQAFHQWFGLEKIHSEPSKSWADKLYEAHAADATKMIESVLDRRN